MGSSTPVSTLPPYSGKEPTCPKCGHVGASTRFLSYGRCQHGSDTLVLGWEPNDRLHRECGNCSYAWDEATTEQAPVREVMAP